MTAVLYRVRDFLREEREATGLPLAALLAVAVAVHVVVLLLAINPWHPDEHFQILEFAWARAGYAPLESLPWEFEARIRPTLQPAMAMAVLEALRMVGVTSSLAWMLVLRLGTLALSLSVVIWVFGRIAPGLGRRGRQVLWLTGPLLWVAPFFMFRFSSENLAGLAFVASLPLLESEKRSAATDGLIGVLLGLAFVLRFQMAFAIAAVLLWLLVSRPQRPAETARITLAAGAVLLIGTAVDAWFYGEWVFTPWLYFEANLLDGVAAQFGTSPWYDYLVMSSLWLAPPLSLVLLALIGGGLWSHPRSPWSWAFVAFVVGHSMVGHKEGRFLLPLFYLAPLLAARGADAAGWLARLQGWRRVLVWGVVAQNVVLTLLVASPAAYRTRNFDAHYMRWLWDVAERNPGETIYVLLDGGNPYLSEPLEANVYRHPRVRGVAHEPGAPIPAEVPPDTPPDRLLLITNQFAEPSVADAATEIGYTAEPGYRVMTRVVGLDDSRFIRWLEAVDGWTESEAPRRVYHVRRAPSSTGGSP